jgi:hypothetical protein
LDGAFLWRNAALRRTGRRASIWRRGRRHRWRV